MSASVAEKTSSSCSCFGFGGDHHTRKAVKATVALHRLAERDTGRTAPRDVLKFVRNGADVLFCPSEKEFPTFLLFAFSGNGACFAACLESKQPIDFHQGFVRWTFYSPENGRAVNYSPNTLFRVVSGRSPEEARIMVRAIVRRLQRHIPGDYIDWEAVFFSEPRYSFLSQAADHQLLHIVWPIVKDLPHFTPTRNSGGIPKSLLSHCPRVALQKLIGEAVQEGVEVGSSAGSSPSSSAVRVPAIKIYAPVCDSDLAHLSEEDKQRFVFCNGFIDTATADLVKVCHQPDVEKVRALVQSGANVQHKSISKFYPLASFLLNCNATCVAACMETAWPLDFMLDENGRSVLTFICIYAHDEAAARDVLLPVVNRIAQNRPGDKVDWEERDWFGHDFFAYAAEYDLLHVVWPLVKELPHFQNKQDPIVISRRVTSEDWDQLSTEDQRRFQLTKGFVSRKFRLRGDRVLYKNGKHIIERSKSSEIKWAKVRELGRGSYGVVYLGQLMNGGLVAVKMPNFHDTEDTEEVVRVLLDELEIMRHLRHPHIITFYGARKNVNTKEGSEQIEIFMEYCPGLPQSPGSLSALLKRTPEMFTMPVVRSYTKQILEGLAYLHRVKVIHRDLKPANVLLTADGVAKLTDFGSSKRMTPSLGCRTLTGTPHFMAPEVFGSSLSSAHYDEEADIWSLGCTVIAMLGREPWIERVKTGEIQLLWHIAHSKEMPSGIPNPCPKDLHDFFTKCFDRDASKRWTAEQLLQHRWITCAESELEEVERPVKASSRMGIPVGLTL